MEIVQKNCREPKWCICYEYDKESDGEEHGCFHPDRGKQDRYWFPNMDILIDTCPLKSSPLTIRVKE